MGIKILSGNSILEVEPEDIIKRYQKLIRKFCKTWNLTFIFDNAIDEEDLIQEINIKLYLSLHHYNYNDGSLPTFIYNVTKNYFLSKKSILTKKGRFPTEEDGTLIFLKSLDETTYCQNNDHFQNDILVNKPIMEVIPNNNPTPYDEYNYHELLKNVRKTLDIIKYKPNNFEKKLRTFVRKLFDTIDEQNNRFIEHVCFERRCSMRKARATPHKNVPNKIYPSIEAISKYLNVDSRAVHLGMRIIKYVILDEAGFKSREITKIRRKYYGKRKKRIK